MKRRTIAILTVLLGAATIVILVVFAPVVSLTADIPGSGGFSTTAMAQGNTTRTLTLVGTPGYGQGLGSMTFCYFGQGALLINGTYYPLTKPTLQIVGASCPAIRVP